VEGGLAIASATAKKRGVFAADCFENARAAESKWVERVKQVPANPKGAWLYNYAWNKFNIQANMPNV